MLVLITYDLKSSEKDYSSLYEAIRNCGSKWWHYMESVWLVRTELSPNECFERLRENFCTEDCCFVVDITQQNRQGWLPSKAWDWIKENDR